MMSWWEAFVWGTLFVAVLLGLLIRVTTLIPYFTAATLVESRRRVSITMRP